MTDITIKFENALKAFKKAPQDLKSVISDLCGIDFANQKYSDRLKTIRDCVEACGKDFEVEFSTERTKWESADETAYREMKFICEAVNEGWEADFSNSNQYKYYMWIKWVSGRGLSLCAVLCDLVISAVGPRLVFQNEERAKFAFSQFYDTYKRFFNNSKNQ